MALTIINLLVLTMFVFAVQITPSQQKRKPDPNNMMLEISEAGEVKQIPLIQPALDAISGFWSSFSTTTSKPVATSTKEPVAQVGRISTPRAGSKPIKSGVATVKPVTVHPVSYVKPTEIVKPLAYHPVAAKPSKSGKPKFTTTRTSTTEKVILKTSSTPEQVTVTPKEVLITIASTLPTKITSSSAFETSAEPTVPPTTTTSIRPSRANNDVAQMTPVPIEYVLRLEELLMQLQEYNNELTNVRAEIKI